MCAFSLIQWVITRCLPFPLTCWIWATLYIAIVTVSTDFTRIAIHTPCTKRKIMFVPGRWPWTCKRCNPYRKHSCLRPDHRTIFCTQVQGFETGDWLNCSLCTKLGSFAYVLFHPTIAFKRKGAMLCNFQKQQRGRWGGRNRRKYKVKEKENKRDESMHHSWVCLISVGTVISLAHHHLFLLSIPLPFLHFLSLILSLLPLAPRFISYNECNFWDHPLDRQHRASGHTQ